MSKKAYFDLHCDTLIHGYGRGIKDYDSLNSGETVINLEKVPSSRNYGQFFAVFVPDSFRGEKAEEFFNFNSDNFIRQCEKYKNITSRCRNYEDIASAFENNKIAACLSIEGGAAFAGKLENVSKAREKGVCACTLTWNGENEIASGSVTDHGVSAFGKECIREMENNNIIVDVSHLNDPGFYDVLKIAKRPFIATHSNARSVCGHLRNLKDDQIKEMIDMKGLIGLNYYIAFLNNDPEKATLDDLYRHAEHILELGGEDVLALGSDFDGSDVFDDLNSMEKAFNLGDYFVSRGIPERIVEKIMSENALNFFKEYFKNGI